MWDTRIVQKFLLVIECPWFAASKAFVTGSGAHKNDFAKTMAYLASFVQHGKEGGQKISVFHAQVSGGGLHRDALVAVIAAEEVATAEEAEVDVGVVASGGRNLIFLPDHTLNRSERFLATLRRARYLIFAININRTRSMRSRYQNHQWLRSPRLRPDRTLVRQPQGRKISPVNA